MTQQQLTLKRTIDAPVHGVWEVLTDLPNAVSRMSGLTRVDLMTSGPYAVGTRWRETRTFFGVASTEEMWVRANDPLRSTVVEAASGGAHYTTTWRLEPEVGADGAAVDTSSPGSPPASTRPASTRLSVEFTAIRQDTALSTATAALFGRLGLRAMEKALQQDIDDIAEAASALSTD